MFRIILKDEGLKIIDKRNNKIAKCESFFNGLEAKIKTTIEVYREENFLKVVKFICKTEPFNIDNIIIDNGDYNSVLNKILPSNYVYRLILIVEYEYDVRCEYDEHYSKYVVCFNKDFVKTFKQEVSSLGIKIIKDMENDNVLKLNKYKKNEWDFYQKIKTYSSEKNIAFFNNKNHAWYFEYIE